MAELAMSHHEAWDRSAAEYASFASRSTLYLDTATALVRAAQIGPGMTIVDLACGSGVVSAAILSLDCDVRIVATDFSAQMIAEARERLASANVSFHCAPAEQLSQVSPARVDRVLCNAAFWQFDQDRALSEIAKILTPSGKCVISVPEALPFAASADVLYREHKLLWMILEEMSLRGYRLPSIHSSTRQRTADSSTDESRVPTSGLVVERIETVAVTAGADDYLQFLEIPVMVERFSCNTGVPATEIAEILDVVRTQLRWVSITVPPQLWKIVILTRSDI
jgi:ubiquinone/menaquinone biosynthesis C-methylase UbiE